LCDRGLVAGLLLSDPARDGASELAEMLCKDDLAHCFCPGCESRRRRHEDPGEDPAVWYDALVADWVIQMRMPGCEEGTLLPLGVHWFDADWADVYRAASDIAHGGEQLARLG
jgi:hypothetical protein